MLAARGVLLAACAASAAAAPRCAGPGARVRCGRSGNGVRPDEPFSAARCRARGCCPDDAAGECFMPWVGDAPNVTTVHLIQSNHFDAGYTNHLVDVINQYFTSFFPRAVSVGADLRKAGGAARLKWLTQSYLVSLYLDCPQGMGIKCPDPSAVTDFKAAVAAGDITWHAFPHNAEMMMTDTALLRFGVRMTHDLDDALGVPRKTVVSLRDVPGFERSVIPVLRAANVTMLSEGMNGRIYPVNVPPAFVWRDGGAGSVNDTVSPQGSVYGAVTPPSGEDILAVWHPKGYGGLGDYVTVPGLAHALAYDWRGDNQGPPTSAKDVESAFSTVQKAFPGATVIASTLDAFAAELDKVRGQLPVVDGEVGDSWIWGVGSDPVKTQRMRALNRQRAAAGAGDDAAVYNFSRQLVKGSEHTWGISVGNFGKFRNTGWPNAEFHSQRAKPEEYVAKFEQEWKSQMQYAVDFPVAALDAAASPAAAALKARIADEYAALAPAPTPDPQAEGFTRAADPGAVLGRVGGWCDFGVDPATGAVTTLVDHAGAGAAAPWADARHPLALQRYQTLTETDYAAWRKEYLIQDCDYEYGKPGQDKEKGWKSEHQLLPPQVTELWYRNGSDAEVLARMDFPAALHRDYGAPAAAWARYSFVAAAAGRDRGVDIAVTYVNKTATRLGEAMFVTMNPPDAPGARDDGCRSGQLSTGAKVESNPWQQHVAIDPPLAAAPAGVELAIAGSVHKGSKADGPCCGNTFELTAQNVSADGFDYAVKRTDTDSGWGQELLLSWKTGGSTCAGQESWWAMDKLGEWVSPLELVDGSPKGLHGVTTGVKFARRGADGAAHHVFFESKDAAMVAWGSPTPFPTPIHAQPNISEGASFLLWDNIWNTNYIFWWPYDTPTQDQHTADIVFRFGIKFLS